MPARLLLALALAAAVARPASAGSLGADCPAGALFSSIECRIASLLDWAQGGGPPVTVTKKIQKLLLKAKTKVTSANLLSTRHRYKPARNRLAKADRNLAKVGEILNAIPTIVTRGLPPTATAAEAAAFCAGIRADLVTVKATLNPFGPVVFSEVCCLRVCTPTQQDPSPCVVTETYPCTSNDCIITAPCLATGCEIYPAIIGTTCADVLANLCTASPTCDAVNPSCVVPPVP